MKPMAQAKYFQSWPDLQAEQVVGAEHERHELQHERRSPHDGYVEAGQKRKRLEPAHAAERHHHAERQGADERRHEYLRRQQQARQQDIHHRRKFHVLTFPPARGGRPVRPTNRRRTPQRLVPPCRLRALPHETIGHGRAPRRPAYRSLPAACGLPDRPGPRASDARAGLTPFTAPSCRRSGRIRRTCRTAASRCRPRSWPSTCRTPSSASSSSPSLKPTA